MIMKRMIYAVLTAMMIFSGCGYHPYYDGQPFRVYLANDGDILENGAVAYVPVVSAYPHVLELYGGYGGEHSVDVADPDILGYNYTKGDKKVNLLDSQMIPARLTLKPKKLGKTVVSVTELDSRETFTINVEICEAYKVLEIYGGNELFETGTMFAFNYLADDDDAKICRRDNDNLEVIADGRYEFFAKDEMLYLEMFYHADVDGVPSADGTETRKLYQVQPERGGSYDPATMMTMLNMGEYWLHAENTVVPEIAPDNYYVKFMFIDVTDADMSSMGTEGRSVFYAYSTYLIPWVY